MSVLFLSFCSALHTLLTQSWPLRLERALFVAMRPTKKQSKKRKKTGEDGRTARRHHTGTLRRGVWCASRRPPLGVRLFLSLFAVSLRFSLQQGHLAVAPFSSCSPLSLLPLSRRSPLPRSAPPPPPAVPLFSRLLSPFGAAPPSLLHILSSRPLRTQKHLEHLECSH